MSGINDQIVQELARIERRLGRLEALESGGQGVALRAVISRSTNQPLSNNTITPVKFDTAYEEGGSFWSALDDTKAYIPQDGWWFIYCGVLIAANTVGDRAVTVKVNGTYDVIRTRGQATSGGKFGVNPSTYVKLDQGDYLELSAYQRSGTALTIDADDFSPCLILRKG